MKDVKKVTIHRITNIPNATDMAEGMVLGKIAQPESFWIAVGVNSQQVVAEANEKQQLINTLTEKKYTVTKVVNDWN